MNKVTITEDVAGRRLDKTIAELFEQYSRSSLEKLITQGAILVNGEVKPSRYRLKVGEVVSTDFSHLEKPIATIELPVLFEDGNVVVINKPIGILAHSKGAFSKEGTVASWLEHKYGTEHEFWESNRAGIVHRLDRGTSGVMICAKNAETQTHLQKQFAKRNVKKTYVAIVRGRLPEESGLIDVPIERNPKKPATFRAGANGKTAQTEFATLKNNDNYSLLELRPHTGRTHQLRVHLNYLKHPIVGDDFYGGEHTERLMLHAHKLEITLPGGIRKIFEAPLPLTFEELMK